MNISRNTITTILQQSICVLMTLFLAPVALGQVDARHASVKASTVIPKRYQSTPFKEGEVLRYSVRWTFVHVGSIELRQLPARNSGDKRRRVRFLSRSASGLPFIDVQLKDQALLDPSDPRLIEIVSKQLHDPKVIKTYRYDVNTNKFSQRINPLDGRSSYEERIEIKRVFDGIGLVMFLRGLSGSGERLTLPTMVDFTVTESRVHCPKAIEYIDVPAFEEDVAAHKISVSSSWEHSAAGGLQGNFELWCSADPAAVLLRAEIELTLGSVVIELESFRREGWKYGS